MCAIMPEVKGTVASHNAPIITENNITDKGVIGDIINIIAVIARPA